MLCLGCGTFQSKLSKRKSADKRRDRDRAKAKGRNFGSGSFSRCGYLPRKMKILESMKDDLNEHILNNMAVSLDLSLEDGVDGYSFLMSELKIRSRFEGKRGERL